MIDALRGAAGVIAITMLASACGPKPVQTTPPPPPGEDLVVLLPDADTHAVGRATVSNQAGSVEISRERESTRISRGQAPAPPTVMPDAEFQALFGDVMASLPSPAKHFILYFRFESDELTDESRALLTDVLQEVKNRPVPEVLVVGHTDTTGAGPANYQLGLRRATMVRTLLVQAGLDPALIEVTSHGEADLLVPTADNVLEARNRRVEITVR